MRWTWRQNYELGRRFPREINRGVQIGDPPAVRPDPAAGIPDGALPVKAVRGSRGHPVSPPPGPASPPPPTPPGPDFTAALAMLMTMGTEGGRNGGNTHGRTPSRRKKGKCSRTSHGISRSSPTAH